MLLTIKSRYIRTVQPADSDSMLKYVYMLKYQNIEKILKRLINFTYVSMNHIF